MSPKYEKGLCEDCDFYRNCPKMRGQARCQSLKLVDDDENNQASLSEGRDTNTPPLRDE